MRSDHAPAVTIIREFLGCRLIGRLTESPDRYFKHGRQLQTQHDFSNNQPPNDRPFRRRQELPKGQETQQQEERLQKSKSQYRIHTTEVFLHQGATRQRGDIRTPAFIELDERTRLEDTFTPSHHTFDFVIVTSQTVAVSCRHKRTVQSLLYSFDALLACDQRDQGTA